jgi:ABC-type Mn2+/Zn2+ transport system permease subunit
VDLLREMFDPEFLLRHALYVSLLIGIVCPLVGVYIVLRRLVFLGVALPQISAAGIAFAYLLHTLGVHLYPHQEEEQLMAMTGSILFALIALLALAVSERGRGLAEGRVGAAYAAAAAASILFVAANPYGESTVLSLLRGEVLGISLSQFWATIAVYGGIAVSVLSLQKEFTFVSFDREMAMSLGKNVVAWDLCLYLIIGLAIAFGVMTVGPLMIFGFLIVPPLAAKTITKGMRAFSLVAALIGGITALVGFYLSLRLDLPLGPTDVAVACVILGVVTVAGKIKRIRRRYTPVRDSARS